MLDILIESTWRSAVIVAAAAVALACLRVHAAAVRHCVWTVVLLAMLLLPLWITWGPEVAVRVLPAEAPNVVVSTAARVQNLVTVTTPVDAPAPAPPPADAGTAQRTAAATARGSWSWQNLLAALYAAGAGVLLARLLVGTIRIRALVRGARRIDGQLTSTSVSTPITIGWLRPVVLLPQWWRAWPPARLSAVLEHEHAHVRRRDPLVQWLALLNRAVFWFNPVAWWLERRLGALAEEACDAAALTRGHEPGAYTQCLLELARDARGRRALPGTVGMARPGNALHTRIRKILDGPGTPTASPARIALAGVTCASLSTVLAAVTLAQQAAPQSAPPSPADDFTPLEEYWFEEDDWRFEVRPIMTVPESEEYLALRAVEERDAFIEAFWARRDPTPRTAANEWREEYESRVEYADAQFADPDRPGMFGYQSMRGTLYVVLGPPDTIEVLDEQGGPYEYWHYGTPAGLGEEFTFRIDPTGRFACGPEGGYELLSPAPTDTVEGAVALGSDPARRIVVHTYPRGFVTLWIPFDFSSAIGAGFELEGDAGTALARRPLPGSLDNSIRLALRLAPQTAATASSSFRFFGSDGLRCTLMLRPGAYRLTADVEHESGGRLSDTVAFEVDE